MGGFFGVASKQDCVADLFYGTDYHSHLGTRRGGLVTLGDGGYRRNIHDITTTPFRAKFEEELSKHQGRMGIGVISDFEDQPLLISSHHGVYAIVTVGRINNLEQLATEAVTKYSTHFSELRGNEFNPTELVAALINREATLEDGIRHAQESIKGSCSVMLLTKNGVYAGRDRLGRTPIIVGEKKDAFSVTLETTALPNLGYETGR